MTKKLRLWLLLMSLLVAAPTLAQPTETGRPTMLADIQEDIDASKLKQLRQYEVRLKPDPAPARDTSGAGSGVVGKPNPDVVTLQAGDLELRVSMAELAKARSGGAKSQAKFAQGLKDLRASQKAGPAVVSFNRPETRNLDHLLAAWALPKGRLVSLRWRGQPVATYRAESYGGGPGQALYPEGQVFYFFLPADRANGFFGYVNIPKPKKP